VMYPALKTKAWLAFSPSHSNRHIKKKVKGVWPHHSSPLSQWSHNVGCEYQSLWLNVTKLVQQKIYIIRDHKTHTPTPAWEILWNQ
jgi:hypothetical protein